MTENEKTKSLGEKTNEIAEAFSKLMEDYYKGYRVKFTYSINLTVEPIDPQEVTITKTTNAEVKK